MPRIPLTPISVDDFTYQPGVHLFLLTHLHTDHLKGLSPTWDHGTILGSNITIGLLKKRMPGLDTRLMKEVEAGTVFRAPVDKAGHEVIDISVLPVAHCIGSVMYLLRGYFGTVMCTGDFRYSSSKKMLVNIPELQRDVIDDIFLDDTFLDPMHDFPDWPTATNQIFNFLDEIERTSKRPLDRILVKVDLWGKEELLIDLATRYETLVVVTPERMEMLELAMGLGLIPDVWTTIPSEGRIVTVSYKPKDTNIAYLSKQGGLNIAAVIPSGWVGTKPVVSKGGRVIRVGYSAHSSFSEILDFIAWLRPQAIQGISRNDGNEAIRKHLFHLTRNYPKPEVSLIDRLQRGKLVPKCVSTTFSRAGTSTFKWGANQNTNVVKTPRRRGVQWQEAEPTQESVSEPIAEVFTTPEKQKVMTPVLVPTPVKTPESVQTLFKDTSDEEDEPLQSLQQQEEEQPFPSGLADLGDAYSIMSDLTTKLANPAARPPLPPRQRSAEVRQIARRLVSVDDCPSSPVDSLLSELIESDTTPQKPKLNWRPPTPPKAKKRKLPTQRESGGTTPQLSMLKKLQKKMPAS
eukprot:TRINITY_DN1964_c2_g1_i1.p1 TRINITY_DN1964_c2_g1~~TRINITY_DN1964_c2_g1_i1.p1  ORF type:complete len:588 (+),score=86.17 TRINITY_DN1964_c2_g1_i1:47-1765(+)